MFTRIVLDSAHSSVFLDRLELGLSEPQRQHLLNLADALLVCEDTKTLARLRRQFPAVLVARAEQGASRGDAQAEAAGASHICMMQRWWIAFRVQAGGWLAVLQVFLAERDNPSPRLDTHGEVMRSGDAPWEPRYICWRGPRVVGRNWRAKVNSFLGGKGCRYCIFRDL